MTPRKRVSFYTLGCRTNQLETAALAEQFEQHQWEVVDFNEPAHLVVVNTCTVTERADVEAQRILRRARLSNPEATLVATGCYAQVASADLANSLKALGGPSYVLGNTEKISLLEWIKTPPPLDQPLVSVSDEVDKSRMLVAGTAGNVGRTRASLKIQDGCDFQCTYCIIWQARGKSRSLPMHDIAAHLQRLLDEGFYEVVLTGINIGQYEDPETGADFATLLQHLVQTVKPTHALGARLRLSSLDPVEVTPNVINTIADSQNMPLRICAYFHLSAQSAHDGVLKRMGRRHHVADLQQVCRNIIQALPQASIAMDIIVGFPGETLEAFEATYACLQDLPLHYLHVFSYSKRKNTPAAAFDLQVPEREKKRRAQLLRQLSHTRQEAFASRMLAQITKMIIVAEELTKTQDATTATGLSDTYVRVKFTTTASTAPGDTCWVEITPSSLQTLPSGEPVLLGQQIR